jgi:peptide deformylase
MAIRPILTAPDPRLKEITRDVDRVDSEMRMLIDDMFDSRYEAKGIAWRRSRSACPGASS